MVDWYNSRLFWLMFFGIVISLALLQEAYGAPRNVTIEVNNDEFWWIYADKKGIDTNMMELDNNNFRFISNVLHMLAYGPTMDCD